MSLAKALQSRRESTRQRRDARAIARAISSATSPSGRQELILMAQRDQRVGRQL